jgi:hypothetical protein
MPGASAEPAHRFLSPHQAAVLGAATRRLIPGPEHHPLELGHPGGHEAHVVTYVDRLLSVFHVAPTDLRAGGPLRQDLILSQSRLASFTSLLFGHIAEAMYLST